MVKINLLPASMLWQRKRRRAQLRYLILTSLILVLLAAGVVFLALQAGETTERLVAVQAERAAVETQIVNYSAHTELQGRVSRQMEMLKQAMGAPPAWVEVLEQVGELIPPNVWLTDLLLTAGKDVNDAGQLTLRGLTYDHPSTARWISALREVEGIAEVHAIFSALEGAQQDEELVRFELRATLPAGPEYDPTAERGEGQ